MAEQEETQEAVDIEEIMQQIREQILAKKAAHTPEGVAPVTLTGKRLPPEFYEHLYQAGLAYDQVHAKLHVTRSSVPVLGPAIEWLRARLHELVLFYVNDLAARQIQVNTHLLRALSILGEELEQLPPPEEDA